MAKKNFSGGLDSLLGGSPISSKKESPVKKATPTPQKVVPSKGENVSSINNLSDEHLLKLEALAKKEGRKMDEIINEAIGFYLEFQVNL